MIVECNWCGKPVKIYPSKNLPGYHHFCKGSNCKEEFFKVTPKSTIMHKDAHVWAYVRTKVGEHIEEKGKPQILYKRSVQWYVLEKLDKLRPKYKDRYLRQLITESIKQFGYKPTKENAPHGGYSCNEFMRCE
jgi:hypothetical protein